MKERYSKKEVALRAARATGQTAIKAAQLTARGIAAFEQRQQLKEQAADDTLLAQAALSAGGYVRHTPDGLYINDRDVYERHEIAKLHSALSCAAKLALRTTDLSPKQKVNDAEVSESDSFVVIDSEKMTRIQPKSSDQYALVKFKNFDEWTVAAPPTTDPNTGNTVIPYYGSRFIYETYTSNGELHSSGTGSYSAPHTSVEKRAAFNFELASSWLGRTAQEVAHAAYADLQAQSPRLDPQIKQLYEGAIVVQPAIYLGA